MRRSSMIRVAVLTTITALALGACTPNTDEAESVPSSSVPSSTTTTTIGTTTTTEPLDAVSAFAATISDPSFSAKIDVAGRQETPAGTMPLSGDALVVGQDSSFRQTIDVSSLDSVVFDARTRQVMGPGAGTEMSDETRVVGEWSVAMENGRWMLSSSSETYDTTVGAIIHTIAATDDWEEAGASSDDPSLTVLRPSSEIQYAPEHWGIDSDVVSGVASSTEVHVSDDGFPVVVHLSVVFNYEDGIAMSRSVYELRLEPVGPGTAIEMPEDVSVSLQDLTEFYAEQDGDGPYPFYDFAVPASMGLVDIGAGFIGLAPTGDLASTGETWNIVFAHAVVDENLTFDESLTGVLDDTGMAPSEIEPSEFGGFPAAIATDGPRQLFYSLFGDWSVIVMWIGTTGDPSEDRAQFDEVLSTLQWTSSGGAVPGSSIGSAELQADTTSVIETVAIATHEDCGVAVVLDTEVIGGDDEHWVEHWTLHTCGGFDTYEVTFTGSPDGGTAILMEDEPIVAYGHDHDA